MCFLFQALNNYLRTARHGPRLVSLMDEPLLRQPSLVLCGLDSTTEDAGSKSSDIENELLELHIRLNAAISL
jgi:hypothetical protein